jgi:hypothetical protein
MYIRNNYHAIKFSLLLSRINQHTILLQQNKYGLGYHYFKGRTSYELVR